MASFVVAMAIGSVIGLAMGQMPALDRALDPWLIVLLNLPALVIIILAYVWFGLNEAAAIGAVALNKIPNVVVTLREGARALDPGLDEMARAYRLSLMEQIAQRRPAAASALFRRRVALRHLLIWKIVLVVELLGRPNGVGFELHLNFQLFNVTAILGYTSPSSPSCSQSNICWCSPLNDAQPAGVTSQFDIRIEDKTYTWRRRHAEFSPSATSCSR